MFIDSVVIEVSSGKGGDGMVHMHREKYRPRGGPDGGDGGRGGDVVLKVNPLLNTLNRFHYNQKFNAQDEKRRTQQSQRALSPDLVIEFRRNDRLQ